ncbi:substrate-binding periplasmic protein [Undibacterium sp. TJN19]|uniref:substrate-binding periplasmic protein n=1 Tax=Undibacterium sp. TJN19 TaxID=3413055 RepID=UPI003BF14E79
MRCRFALLFFILCTLLPSDVLAARACERIIVSADPAYPPLHWHDGRNFHGASIIILTRILNDLGLPYELRYLGPWKRVLSAAQNGSIDLIATLKTTPERRNFLLFSDLVLLNPVAAFVRKGNVSHYVKWEDLIGYRGGISRGNRFGNPFDDFMDSRLNINEADNLETSFKMLMGNRFDYVITGYYPGSAYLASVNMGDKIVPLTPFIIETANLFGFVANSPCTMHLPAFNRQLQKLHREGFIERALMQAKEEWRLAPALGKI